MSTDLQQQHIRIINQLFELEKKLSGKEELASLYRHVDRIKNTFEEMGLQVLNPEGEPYSETRTDCSASITGSSVNNLVITSVIKPIVYGQQQGTRQLLQKGVVVVEAKN
jgi:hypothetical protein